MKKAGKNTGREKNLPCRVDKPGWDDYNKCNITKLAVKRRVGLRIDLSREPGRWKRAGNRGLKMVSELRGRRARAPSPRRERPLQRPAVSRGMVCPGRSIEAASRKGAVKQGGTTEAFCAPVLAGHDGPQGRERFCIRSSAAGGAAGTVPPGKNKTLYC